MSFVGFNDRGSPPRVREPHRHGDDSFLSAGITPACAGTTSVCNSELFTVQDHPRVCGNHLASHGARAASQGSPPRVREPRTCCLRYDGGRRITPACAGTTGHTNVQTTIDRDHPRVCGNHSKITIFVENKAGSPPRVREPLWADQTQQLAARITPACAGTTPVALQMSL